ncbi:hypothetical protein CBR_g1028 [Chara braunii]|uniref:Uncharacterized protein n=1 Tax=Chara braunii TaxID=69332 RepID=A0A388KCY9_CHABU|nr:hypothetical protein CBR_g1028 [Chara braunii]|eukprot:GBG67909.1 hypothetical protein CBR_g1028 [Chara braunii]
MVEGSPREHEGDSRGRNSKATSRDCRDDVVVGYLRVGKMEIPLLVVTNNLSENISESPVRDLGLIINLGMVRRGEAELVVNLVKSSPESAGKAWVTVRYDA